MFSLCCCGGAGDPRIKFGFARHRRWGFVPKVALNVSAPLNQPQPPKLSTWSPWEVYSALEIFEKVTFTADAARNEEGSLVASFDHRSGFLSQTRSGPPNGPRLEVTLPTLPTSGLPLKSGNPGETVQESVTESSTRVEWSYNYTNNPESPLGGGPTDGRFTRIFERKLTGHLTQELMRSDLDELLNAIDFDAMEWPRDITDNHLGGETWRLAEFDANGDIRLRETGVHLRASAFVPPARDSSGIFFPNLFNVGTGGRGVNGADVGLWAGWTPNPIDADVTAFPNGDGGDTRTLGGPGAPNGLDQFSLLAGKCYMQARPSTLIQRRTESPWGGQMIGEVCSNLAAQLGGKSEFMLGATAADESARPNVLSLYPWADWIDGAFLQVNQEPCG